jgi:hypothetical protein
LFFNEPLDRAEAGATVMVRRPTEKPNIFDHGWFVPYAARDEVMGSVRSTKDGRFVLTTTGG